MNNPYRNDFPALNTSNQSLVYLDNAATTQKPQIVLEAMDHYYRESNANPLRGLYDLSIESTRLYEKARHAAAELIHAKSDCEIIFTRNTTESLNLIAFSYGLSTLKPGDEIVISVMEHHSNILPWQMAARQTGARLVYLYPQSDGTITEDEINQKITPQTKIVSVTHVSNVLGCQLPLTSIIRRAHRMGAVVVADGAQAVPHQEIHVQELDADFYAFSGHKMMGPMGIGVLYGKQKLLEQLPPFLTGGEMIEHVTEQSATYAPLPEKFEAGTPNVGGAVGLASAISYLKQAGYDKIERHNEHLLKVAMEELKQLPYITVYGSKDYRKHCNILSFNIEDAHPHDVATILNEGQVAIRTGHHCAQPLMKYLNINACCRASFYLYNTEDDAVRFIEQVKQVRRWLRIGA